MSGKMTTAQWRRAVPAYDQLIRAVEHLTAHWPGHGRAPRIIAHVHPDTRIVSVVLDGTPEELIAADQVLVEHGYQRGWTFDRSYGHPVWRKVVNR